MNLYECTCLCGCQEVTSDYVCRDCKDGNHDGVDKK